MSLTSHLKNPNSPISQFIRQRFSRTPRILKEISEQLKHAHTIRPVEQPFPYRTIGTAIDYRIRYTFAITPIQRLVAWLGCWELISDAESWLMSEKNLKQWEHLEVPSPSEEASEGLGYYSPAVIVGFFHSLESTLARIQPVGRNLDLNAEQLLARYCYVLALFEEVFREGLEGRAQHGPLFLPFPKKSVEELLAIPQEAWIDDLCSLSSLFYEQFHKSLSLSYILNPTFTGSGDVGGADADFIMNQCLLELKTTIQVKSDPNWLWQLVGYLLLDYEDTYQINTVGIYMTRQGLLFQWPVNDFIHLLTENNTISLSQLRQEFQSLCKNMRLQYR